MGLLNNKNANEAAYVGGKKHWTDVIKNSGPGDCLIWRQPEEDFNTNSTLIVMPGEEAIFVNEGIIVQTFENGTYKLSTSNYPFISRLRNAFSGGVSSFNCVVYFVRKAVSKELLWGTSSRIQVRDKMWGIRTDVGARGAYKLCVDQAGVLLTKLLGNKIAFLTQDEIFDSFGQEMQSIIVSAISAFLNEWPGELIGLEAHLQKLSETLLPQIDERLKDYGLSCKAFSVSGLIIDQSKYDVLDESQMELIARQRQAQADKVAKLLNAEADAGVFEILGDNWAKLQSAGILQELAANPGAGGIASAGAGLGMGLSAGGVFGGLANQMFASYSDGQQQKSGSASQASKPPAGPDGGEDVAALLQKLKSLLDQGILPQNLYEEKVKEVLSRM